MTLPELLERIREQAEKEQFFNALTWHAHLQVELVRGLRNLLNRRIDPAKAVLDELDRENLKVVFGITDEEVVNAVVARLRAANDTFAEVAKLRTELAALRAAYDELKRRA